MRKLEHFPKIAVETARTTKAALTDAVRAALRGRHSGAMTLVAAGFVTLAVSDVRIDAAFPPDFDVTQLFSAQGGDGTQGLVLRGEPDERVGEHSSFLGDINGDGFDDVAISSRAEYGIYGPGVKIVFGRLSGPPAEIDLTALMPQNGGDGSGGFHVEHSDASSRRGAGIERAGDVNADGIADFMFGQEDDDYIVFGRTTGFPAVFDPETLRPENGGDGSQGFVFIAHGSGALPDQRLCSLIGDVNGDGIDDMAFVNAYADPQLRSNAGEVYVLFGRDTPFPAQIDVAELRPRTGGDGTKGFVIAGVDALDNCCSVNGAGDVNADGIDDIVLGAPMANSKYGEAYVVFGRTHFTPLFQLQRLFPANGGHGTEGFVLRGIDELDAAGWAVSGAGDVNGDGIDDFAIGAPQIPPDFYRAGPGEAYVIFGRASPFPPTIRLETLEERNGGDGSVGVLLEGFANGLGTDLNEPGDVNGDGFDDLVIGQAYNATYGSADPRPVVLFGRPDGFPPEIDTRELTASRGGDGSDGFVLIMPPGDHPPVDGGDFNGDGISDVLATSSRDFYADSEGGFIVFGRIEPDGDGDGVVDIHDNCPVEANADQIDGDADAVGDVCDNCSAVANEDQRDTNADGFGNICDADLNDDCIVNAADAQIMRDALGTGDDDADLDGSSRVDGDDVAILQAALGDPPGPSGVPNVCEAPQL